MGDSTHMFTFTMASFWDGCKCSFKVTKFITSSFCLMSFEYGLSSALNAVGFIHTMKEVLYQIGLNLPASIFSYEITGFVQINPLACLLVLALTLIMLKGI